MQKAYIEQQGKKKISLPTAVKSAKMHSLKSGGADIGFCDNNRFS